MNFTENSHDARTSKFVSLKQCTLSPENIKTKGKYTVLQYFPHLIASALLKIWSYSKATRDLLPFFFRLHSSLGLVKFNGEDHSEQDSHLWKSRATKHTISSRKTNVASKDAHRNPLLRQLIHFPISPQK